jgi:spermidine synthase
MTTIAEHTSKFGVVTICESKETRGVSYKHGDVFQSQADMRGVSTASYIHAIYGLIRQTRARKVLMVGCGGGTLGTMLAHAGYRVAIVEIDPQSFVLARRFFGLPATVECHVADGFDYLRTTRERYDAIVLDAYVGDTMPEHLKSQAFFAAMQAALSEGGCVFANVHLLEDRDPDADTLGKALEAFWPKVRILDAMGQTNRNAIVTAGAVARLTPPLLEIVPQHDADVVESELGAMTFREPRIHSGK